MSKNTNLKIGLISDGKYGERAYENIKKVFDVEWIKVPDIPTNIMLDDDFELEITDCDLYISYVRHPDIILELSELKKPLILGVLPGIGLLKQAKSINPQILHAPTMCSLESNTGIPEFDNFTHFFGKPIFDIRMSKDGIFEKVYVRRKSLCGSTEAGAKFLSKKKANEDILREFALNICHECRAPRFGHTCDKEVAGINHLVALFDCISPEDLSIFNQKLKNFMKEIREEYNNRMKNSRKLLEQVI